MSMSQTVAALEADLESVERQAQELEMSLALVTHERDTLREQLSKALAERDEFMLTASQMRSIMESTSMGLVQGLKRMADAQERRRVMTQERQSRELGVDEKTSPLFIRKRRPSANPEEQKRLEELANAIAGDILEKDYAASPQERVEEPELPSTLPVPPRSIPRPMPAPQSFDDHPYNNDPRMPKVNLTQQDIASMSEEERRTYVPKPEPRSPAEVDAENLRALSGRLDDPNQRPFIRDRQS
jgi:hypothetical protein